MLYAYFAIKTFFAGLGPIVGHIGFMGVIIAAMLAIAWFFPPFRRLAALVALLSAIGLAGYIVGVTYESKRCTAQWNAALKAEEAAGNKARARAERAIPLNPARKRLRNDRYNRDKGK